MTSKAAGESKPEAYHFSPAHPKLPRQLVLRVGYVEDFDESRTTLAACFNILRLSHMQWDLQPQPSRILPV
ncbi:MAG: hypothetical protein JW395_2748 [Nitrospira sp.]|nr:hypothetical protein [Nitrospira sp.]